MKKIFVICIVVMITPICFSCRKDSDYQLPDVQQDKSEYYVKYEAKSVFYSFYILKKVIIKDTDGLRKNTLRYLDLFLMGS